ncbi:ATP-binding cassette domain-containing protein [Amycolatopsis jejuensis]|uniref:ATP-binding cassette domain-containing protein n=1 Tax=Amycolatopsis jejuensis TaxID=330084 RepID=UPI0006909A5A|nr:sugar ABC transporter ATP-binding protein [Amycolatopsis jejuensis]
MTGGLTVSGVVKSFGPNRVLDGVDLQVGLGEIHGLLGLNGSGKSTLVKVLSGYHRADAGLATFGGEPLGDGTGRVVVLHQDLGLEPSLPVLDNVVVASRYATRALAPVRRRALAAEVGLLLEELQARIHPRQLVADLPAAARAQVAFARAMFRLRRTSGAQPMLFILDEPTANLPTGEVQHLIDTVRRVAEAGNAVIYVSHRMAEIDEVTHRLSILRDGRVALSADTRDVSRDQLIEAMLGASLDAVPLRSEHPLDPRPGLEVRGLSTERLRAVDLDAPRGIVTGVTGLAGMGCEDLPEVLAGLRKPLRGTVSVDGSVLPARHGYRVARQRGVALVPADRLRAGLWREGSARDNVSITVLSRFHGRLGLSHSRERAGARQVMADVGVTPLDADRPVWAFSGGNQQKMLLGKWLQTDPSTWILHEPTQGVDAAASQAILLRLRAVADSGAVVLIVSGDFSQLAQICDRVHVIREGDVVGTLDGGEVTERDIARLAQGSAAELVREVRGG